jgi:predicted anti-sigma-YlaC factor YlaD
MVRETLSALLDGEVPAHNGGVDAHVAGCTDCRSWEEAAHRLTRRVRLTSARPMGDGTARILEAVVADRPPRRSARGRQLVRAGLAVAALAQFVIIIPALVLGQAGIGVPAHAARELGAFNLALAVGFAVTALRPQHARGMRPLVGAATMCLIVVSVIDTANGETTLLAETPHVIALAGLVLLHLVAEWDSSTEKRWWMPLTTAWNRSAARLARGSERLR